MLPDIGSREDIERLMSAFYSVALTDGVIGHHFERMDLAAHLPVISDFWEKALFGRPVYFGNAMHVHQVLDTVNHLEPEHFDRWIEIFTSTVDSLFDGEIANAAKLRARMIAHSMSQRLNMSSRFNGRDMSQLVG